MKHYQLLLSVALFIFSSCGQSIRSADNSVGQGDSTLTTRQLDGNGLIVKLQINEVIKFPDSVQLKFTIYNAADSIEQFCKWHTPFEPLMSKYLDVKDENGQEVLYKGPMAKRVMPPPADSYIKIKAKDSLTASVDVLKGYAITKPGKYTIIYNSDSISGLITKDSVTFQYQ